MPVKHVTEQALKPGNRTAKPCEVHDASCSESEPVSASKHNNVSGQPLRGGEASTDDEVTGKSSHPAHRGDRGQRVSRERVRNLGDPACWSRAPDNETGNQ